MGVHDDFFSLGGDSIHATMIISRVRAAFNVELSASSLFEAPTVAAFAVRVEEIVRAAGAEREEIEL